MALCQLPNILSCLSLPLLYTLCPVHLAHHSTSVVSIAHRSILCPFYREPLYPVSCLSRTTLSRTTLPSWSVLHPVLSTSRTTLPLGPVLLHTPSTSHTLKGRPFSSCALCFVQRLVNYLETLVLLKHAPETDTTTALLATQDKGMSHVERQEQLSEF